MAVRIGRYRSAFVVGYKPAGVKRFGVLPFGNGFTLRAGPVAAHFWRLSDLDKRGY